MILNAIIHGEQHCAEKWEEMSELITEVMHNLRVERTDTPWISPGEMASFAFADRCLSPGCWPDSFLYVAVNASTGFGGLTWIPTIDGAKRMPDGIGDNIWVSDNPSPPSFDPRVVSDTGFPLFYSPRSTLPAQDVHAALEELCRSGTGMRPECIHWVPGEMNGQRLDEIP